MLTSVILFFIASTSIAYLIELASILFISHNATAHVKTVNQELNLAMCLDLLYLLLARGNPELS
jgi:hypothetical protein